MSDAAVAKISPESIHRHLMGRVFGELGQQQMLPTGQLKTDRREGQYTVTHLTEKDGEEALKVKLDLGVFSEGVDSSAMRSRTDDLSFRNLESQARIDNVNIMREDCFDQHQKLLLGEIEAKITALEETKKGLQVVPEGETGEAKEKRLAEQEAVTKDIATLYVEKSAVEQGKSNFNRKGGIIEGKGVPHTYTLVSPATPETSFFAARGAVYTRAERPAPAEEKAAEESEDAHPITLEELCAFGTPGKFQNDLQNGDLLGPVMKGVDGDIVRVVKEDGEPLYRVGVVESQAYVAGAEALLGSIKTFVNTDQKQLDAWAEAMRSSDSTWEGRGVKFELGSSSFTDAFEAQKAAVDESAKALVQAQEAFKNALGAETSAQKKVNLKQKDARGKEPESSEAIALGEAQSGLAEATEAKEAAAKAQKEALTARNEAQALLKDFQWASKQNMVYMGPRWGSAEFTANSEWLVTAEKTLTNSKVEWNRGAILRQAQAKIAGMEQSDVAKPQIEKEMAKFAKLCAEITAELQKLEAKVATAKEWVTYKNPEYRSTTQVIGSKVSSLASLLTLGGRSSGDTESEALSSVE